ncbi:MAG: response regulator [bacterium]
MTNETSVRRHEGKKLLIAGRDACFEFGRSGFKKVLEEGLGFEVKTVERARAGNDVLHHRPHVLVLDAAEAGDARGMLEEIRKNLRFISVFLAVRAADLHLLNSYVDSDVVDFLLMPLDRNELFPKKMDDHDAYRCVHVVEDDRGVVDYYTKFLEMYGYVVTASPTGLDALLMKKAGKMKARVLLVDVRMPGMDGVKFVERLREFDSDTAVIMATGERDTETVASAAKLGISGYLGKPISLRDSLLPELRKVFFRKKLMEMDAAYGAGVCSTQHGSDIPRMIEQLKDHLLKTGAGK